MANGEVVVAVDVSMAQLDVAQWPSGESFSVDNEAAEWRSCWPGARSGSRRQSWSRPAGGRRSAGLGVVRGAGCGGGG